MFGLGMNNNGTGLVLASLTLAAHPAVMLPIIFYNLVQHVVAGIVDFALPHAHDGQRASFSRSFPEHGAAIGSCLPPNQQLNVCDSSS